MKIVGRIRSTATQEVEAEGEDYVAAHEQLLASISERFELLHVRRDSWTAALARDVQADADAPCRLLVGGGVCPPDYSQPLPQNNPLTLFTPFI